MMMCVCTVILMYVMSEEPRKKSTVQHANGDPCRLGVQSHCRVFLSHSVGQAHQQEYYPYKSLFIVGGKGSNLAETRANMQNPHGEKPRLEPRTFLP